MNDGGEVALFVDFENIRFSMLNNYGLEPDPQLFMAKALTYGPVSVPKAYADFSRHPESLRRKLEVAGIDIVNVPLKVVSGREQSSADLYMLMDIIDTVLDRPQVNTFLLMTGDRDFLRVSAKLKNRFGRTVVISGVPGAISVDLVASASKADPLEMPSRDDLQRQLIKRFADLKPRSGYTTWSFLRAVACNEFSLHEQRANAILSDFVGQDILKQSQVTIGDTPIRATVLNFEHVLVQQVVGIRGTPDIPSAPLGSGQPASLSKPPNPIENPNA